MPVTDSVNGSRVVGYARFFLLTASNYSQAQGNEPWCGEFIGIGAPEGGDTEGGNTSRGRDASPAMELRKERGSSILEFAIGASLLVLLFTGIFQFGYTFYAYSKLENAVRAGARFAALSVYPVSGPTTNSSPTSAFVTQVKNVTVYGHPNGGVDGRTPMVSGLTTAHVSVNVAFSNMFQHRFRWASRVFA